MSCLYSRLKQLVITGEVNEVKRFFTLNPNYVIDINLLYLSIKYNQQEILQLFLFRTFPSTIPPHEFNNNNNKENCNFLQEKHYDFKQLLLSNIESKIQQQKKSNPMEIACEIVEKFLTVILIRKTNNKLRKINSQLESVTRFFIKNRERCLWRIEHLLHCKHNLNAWDAQGWTPLCKSIQLFGHYLVDILLDNGANVNIPTVRHQTALHFASSYYNNSEAFHRLLKLTIHNYYSIDVTGCIPLYYAVMKQNSLTTEILLDKFPDNKNDSHHKMAFCLAILNTETRRKNKTIVKHFIKRGYTLVHRDFFNLNIPQSWINHLRNISDDPEYDYLHFFLNRELSLEALFEFLVLKAIIEHGYTRIFQDMIEDIDAVELEFPRNGSLLHLASKYGRVTIAKDLLRRGALEDVVNDDKMTPLHFAVMSNHWKIVKILMRQKVNLTEPNIYGERPLFIACKSSAMMCLKILLNAGCNVNCPDSLERSPLHIAAAQGNVTMVKLLLKYGANFEAKDKDGNTPLDICLRINTKGNRQIAKLLLDNKASYSSEQKIHSQFFNKIMTAHAIKMNVLNINETFRYNLNDKTLKFNDFFIKCTKEKTKMSSMKLPSSNGISILNLLTGNDYTNSLLLRNEAFVNYLRAINLKQHCPIYYSMLKTQIINGAMKGMLTEIARHCLRVRYRRRKSTIFDDSSDLGSIHNIYLRRLIVLSPLETRKKQLVLERNVPIFRCIPNQYLPIPTLEEYMLL